MVVKVELRYFGRATLFLKSESCQEKIFVKRVVLLVIDALTGPLLSQEMANGRYPHFKMLQEIGVYHEQCVSIFPSITHAALTSIATGQYPAQHGVIASHWYDEIQDKVVYFSGSLGMVLKKGMGNFFREFLLDLNTHHLQSPTIFQLLEREGYETACINFPIYRGDVEHKVNMPLLLSWLPGLPSSTTIKGPKRLLLGDLLANPNELDIEASFTGVAHWFGFRDNNTIDLLLQMAESDEFPDFTLAYFPDNDLRAHEDGPDAAHKQLAALDEMLGNLFEKYGGLDAFLPNFTLLITADHSQSATVEDAAAEAVDLKQILATYRLAEAGQPWQDTDQIMACPNLRAAQLYFKAVESGPIMEVVTRLLAEPRLDQLMYRAELLNEGEGYVVQNSNGRLHFLPGSTTNSMAVDRYGNAWAWDGDLSVVDGRLQGNTLIFPTYPNAFERIAGLLDAPASGQIWLTAKPGYEIIVPSIKQYANGGSHASLHRLDSQPPLFIAGAPKSVKIPDFPRTIDIVPLCRAVLKAAEVEPAI